jgi:hypothetical protein
VGDTDGELVELREGWTDQTWELLDDVVRSEENGIRSEVLLNDLLVLLELLESFLINAVDA